MWTGPEAFAPTRDGALEFEQYLNALDDTQLVSWFQHQLASYVLLDLKYCCACPSVSQHTIMVLDVLTSCSALICCLLFTRQVIDIRLYAMGMLYDIEDIVCIEFCS